MKNELKKNKNWCQIVPSIPWLENSPLLEKKNTDDRAGEIKGTNIDGAALIVGQNHN